MSCNVFFSGRPPSTWWTALQGGNGRPLSRSELLIHFFEILVKQQCFRTQLERKNKRILYQ